MLKSNKKNTGEKIKSGPVFVPKKKIEKKELK